MKFNTAELYEKTKYGALGDVLKAWRKDPALARECAHFAKPTSGWTFLHQAALHGDWTTCRTLIRNGADPTVRAKDGLTAIRVAEKAGHHGLAQELRRATTNLGNLWKPPRSAELLASSPWWDEARPKTAKTDLRVSYAGGQGIEIPKGSRYFADSFGRVLVGWHGTYNPPCGMDGYPIINL